MKKAATIISMISGAILALLGLVFVVIEGRLLFSGDFLVYPNPVGGLFNIIFKLILALFTIAIGIFPYLHLGKQENRERIIANGVLTLALLINAIVLEFVFASSGYEFYIYLVGLAMAVIYIVCQFIIFLKSIILVKDEGEESLK